MSLPKMAVVQLVTCRGDGEEGGEGEVRINGSSIPVPFLHYGQERDCILFTLVDTVLNIV